MTCTIPPLHAQSAMRKQLLIWGVILIMGFFSSAARAQNTGDMAPDFSAPATNGKTMHLKDLKGQWVVLYFYPKAFTPGCTKESCSLRDHHAEITKEGAVILGVSLDDIATQKKFKEKYRLPFELLSDADKTMARAFNTLGFMGLYTKRVTYLISPEGKIAHVFEDVNAATHDRQVLDKLRELKK